MENINKAIEEFNEFKNPAEAIYTRDKWTGDWNCKSAVLLIWAEYICNYQEQKDACHIHWEEKYDGSKRFNEWLDKYNLIFEWYGRLIGYIRIKKSSDQITKEISERKCKRINCYMKHRDWLEVYKNGKGKGSRSRKMLAGWLHYTAFGITFTTEEQEYLHINKFGRGMWSKNIIDCFPKDEQEKIIVMAHEYGAFDY
jgi:hypothetical protein